MKDAYELLEEAVQAALMAGLEYKEILSCVREYVNDNEG